MMDFLGRTVGVRVYSARTLTSEFVNRWEELETRTLEGNFYLSPHFVLPALRHLPSESHQEPFILGLEAEDGGDLLGLGVFESSSGSRLLPLPHLSCWRTVHSTLDGVLLDRDRASEAAAGLFRWLREQGGRWNGVFFRNRSAGSELATVLEGAASQFGSHWQEDGWIERAAIPTAKVPRNCIRDLYPAHRRKRVRRSLRRLEALGSVQFELDWCENGFEEAFDRFLELEAMGWKGEQKTALICHPGHEAFARDLVGGLAGSRRVLFTHLRVEDDLVATALSFRSGDALFGFKIGWDPRFAHCSPGFITDLKLLQASPSFSGIELVDGCTVPGSWLEAIWPWRRRLTTGVFPTTSAGNVAVGAALRLKRLKRSLTSVANPVMTRGTQRKRTPVTT